MRTSVKLNVSAHYFFKRMIDSRIYDIYEATGNLLAEDALPGIRYESENEYGQSCRVSITSLLKDHSYRYLVETNDEVISTDYELKQLSADQVEVDFSQKVHAKHLLHGLKNKTASILFDRLKANNFKRVLKGLEVGY